MIESCHRRIPQRMVVQSARIAGFRRNSTSLPSSGGSNKSETLENIYIAHSSGHTHTHTHVTNIQPTEFEVSFLQSQNSIEYLVLYVVFVWQRSVDNRQIRFRLENEIEGHSKHNRS